MQSLDELRRVIRRVEARRPPRPAAPPAHEVLGGEVVETGAGPLVVVRREYPLTHVHGREPLAPAFTAPLELLSTVARAAAPAGDSRRLIFLDTETTGLAGGTGTYAFLVGVGRLDGDRFVVVQYFMRDFDEEPALLAALVPLLEQAAGSSPSTARASTCRSSRRASCSPAAAGPPCCPTSTFSRRRAASSRSAAPTAGSRRSSARSSGSSARTTCWAP